MTARRVTLDGGAPWGFRMQGGAEVGQPLRISRVNPGSKAAGSGVREGDVISTIDGLSTIGLSKQDAHGLLRQAGPTLTLGLSGSGSRRKGNAKRISEAVVVNGAQLEPVVQEPSPPAESASTANDRSSDISPTAASHSRGRRKVRRRAWGLEGGLDLGVPGFEPLRKVSNPPDVAGPKLSPSKARRLRAYRAKMRRAQERAGSPVLETVPEDIPGESRVTENETETTAPGVKTRKPMLNLLHAESVESDDSPMVMEVLDTGYLSLTDTGDQSARDSGKVQGVESFVIVVTEEVNPTEHESEIRIKEIEEFVVTSQNRKESDSPEMLSKNEEVDRRDTPVKQTSPCNSPTTKYPPLEEAYLDHKIQQLDLAYKRVSSPTRDFDKEEDNTYVEFEAQEVVEEVVWEEASELFIFQDPLLVKDFETGDESPDLFRSHPESSTDCQDSVQAAGGGDSAATEEKTEPREVEITTTKVSNDAVTCFVGDYKLIRHRHTLPYFMHSEPRFLDVIFEENSDVSDSEKSPCKQSRRNTIPSTSQRDVSLRLDRPLRFPGIHFKRRRDPRAFEGDCQPAKKMVVKMAEVKVEKVEPTSYDVVIEEVSSTPAQFSEVSVLPESSCADPDDTDNYMVLEQSSDGEPFSSKCLPRSNDEGGVEIVYLETSSSASSLSSRTLTNQEELLEDDRENEINFDRVPMPRLSEQGIPNLTSDMPDIIQDASTPISMWLQSSVEPNSMEGSLTSIQSETRPASIIEDSVDLAPSSTSRLKTAETQTSFPLISEDVTDICDDLDSKNSDIYSLDVLSCPNAEQIDIAVSSSDISEFIHDGVSCSESSNQKVGSSDTSSLVNKMTLDSNIAEKREQISICSFEVQIEENNLNENNELVCSGNAELNEQLLDTTVSSERSDTLKNVHGNDNAEQSDENDFQSAPDGEHKSEICRTKEELSSKKSPEKIRIPNGFPAISIESIADDDNDVPDLDTLIKSLKRIAESDIPIRRPRVPGNESSLRPDPLVKPEEECANTTSSKNPLARMIADFFQSKRKKEKSDIGREAVTSPTYRSYSESVARSTGGSSVTSPVTSRSQTPCSQSNSYSADMSRNGSLSPALIRELEFVLKSRPLNRYRESESSSLDSPVRTMYPTKQSSSSQSHSPVDTEFMSPPPYSRQVSSSSAASQSTAVYNPRLSPVSSDETESTYTSKEPERRGVFEHVFRAINLKKSFPTAARPSKLNLRGVREDRVKGSAVSPRLARCVSEPLTVFGQEKSASSPLPSRSCRGQSLATERTLADGKLVFLSSPPLATSPPPCGRKKGIRPRDNAHILLCLSPSQRRCFKNRLPTPEESADLLDLHQKFIERRAYHEIPAPPPRKHSPKPRSVYADTIDWINSIPLYSSDDDWLAVGENGESSDPARSLYCPPCPDDVNRRTIGKVSVESNAEIDLSRLLAILREECAQQHSHQRLLSDRHATDFMSPWFTPKSKAASDVDEPVTYVLHAGGNNKYEFRSDCAKNAAINFAKRVEETANKVKWKTDGDATCSRTFSSILKEKLFWNLNNIVDSKEVRHTPPKPKSMSSECIASPEKIIPAYKISQQGDIAHLREKCTTNGDSTSLYEDLSPGSKYWKESRIPRPKTHSKESSTNKEVVSRINVHQNQVLPSPPTKHREPHPKSRPINPSEEERLRDQMYEEYMHQVAERNRRREQKVIKISDPDSVTVNSEHRKDGARTPVETTVPRGAQLEQEFMDKVRARMAKYGLVENGGPVSSLGHSNLPPEKNCVVIKAAGSQKEATVTAVQQLPKHLQEFLSFTVQEEPKVGVWSPHQSQDGEEQEVNPNTSNTSAAESPRDDALPAPVWTPRSAGASPSMERKAFRPVNFESPTLPRKNKPQNEKSEAVPPWQETSSPPTHNTASGSVTLGKLSSPDSPGRLPRAPNPTMTLLQKAREGQIPKGAHYLDKEPHEAKPSDIMYTVRKEYDVSGDRTRTITHVEPRKFDGIGPTTKEGVPVVLRSAVRNESKDKWYKKMYDSLHKVKENDEYVTVRYRNNPRKDFENFHLTRRRDGTGDERTPFMWPGGRSSASSGGGAQSSPSTGAGYQSEPELSRGYDSDTATKSKTLDRRRETQRSASATSVASTPPTPPKPSPAAAPPKTSSAASASAKSVADSVKYASEIYKNQPGRIENYEPGHSSISDKEAQQWWDEVLDIFDGWLDERCTKRKYRRLQADARRISMEQRNKENATKQSFMSHALKESGYESDTQLIVRRRDAPPPPLSPAQQRSAYQTVQKGGEVPLHGLRRAPPDRPKESPHRYVDSEVTIRYKSPVSTAARRDAGFSEEELARRQAEAMRRLYQEERRRKYLTELQDINARRHTDYFTPSQKSPIPLNRYDDFPDDRFRSRTPEPRLVARALYNFVGQTPRELSFRRGDIIFVKRQIDKNWFEGEHNAMVGLFPFNYVEILPYDGLRTSTKPREGQARAKYNFIAQTNLELSLIKGELVTLIRRVDNNWFEGRIGIRKGIFPVSYVDVLLEPGDSSSHPQALTSSKPVASPAAHSLMLNGGAAQMSRHSYTPSSGAISPGATATSGSAGPGFPGYSACYGPTGAARINAPVTGSKQSPAPVNQTLHIDTQLEPVPYRALYNYRPQNDDELELVEGDLVLVMEKCDDGWYVGSSQRSGFLGTFPGNYVERI